MIYELTLDLELEVPTVADPDQFVLAQADCLQVLKLMKDNSIDSIVTDPPYGLSFMGKKWDYDVPDEAIWRECLRVLKPGGHLLSFAGTRTQHRMAVRIEDAGFEIRDMIAWVYGSGFPKSLDVSKAIDKMGGVDTAAFKASLHRAVERSGMSRVAIDEACGFTMRFDTPYESDPAGWGVSLPSPEKWEKIAVVLGMRVGEWAALVDRVWRGRAGAKVSANGAMSGGNFERTEKGDPVTDAARQWQGWGTALKPALEPITVARKPLVGTVAENVLAHGVGALNIDGCRVAGEVPRTVQGQSARSGEVYGEDQRDQRVFEPHEAGRWPANLIHDGSDEVLTAFPQASERTAAVSGTASSEKTSNVYGRMRREGEASADSDNEGAVGFKMKPGMRRLDTGSAARFFYCAKASKKDRDEGLEDAEDRVLARSCQAQADAKRGIVVSEEGGAFNKARVRKNNHPTVKPTDLMRYLCRLVTPTGGVVLDPFMGSGSTGKAAVLEGFRFVGIEREAEYLEIAKKRITTAQPRDPNP